MSLFQILKIYLPIGNNYCIASPPQSQIMIAVG